MEYHVEAETETGYVVPELGGIVNGERRAKKLAEQTADEHPELYVYIKWFRASDGQHGYLNRDGHSPVGKRW